MKVVADPLLLPLGDLQDRLFQLPPLAGVPHDGGEPAELARLVPHARQHDFRPEPTAVLAHPPALVPRPPRTGGGLEVLSRLAPLHVLGREKAVVGGPGPAAPSRL